LKSTRTMFNEVMVGSEIDVINWRTKATKRIAAPTEQNLKAPAMVVDGVEGKDTGENSPDH